MGEYKQVNRGGGVGTETGNQGEEEQQQVTREVGWGTATGKQGGG